MLIRTWNVFHGNAYPPQRRGYLEEALALAVSGEPDVVCLQELPAWALARVEAWTGYTAVTALAARPTLGPLPSTTKLGRVVTSLHPGLLRSAFSGQGNAILLARRLRLLDTHVCVLNPRRFRRGQAAWLGLRPSARVAWAKERRVCQAVRIVDGERTLLVANLHATSYPPDERLADAELLRAFVFIDGLARPDEPAVVAGDFNVTFERSATLRALVTDEWGFSPPGPGIDQILVRNLEIVSGPTPWPVERHRVQGVVLSDHTPLELVVE